ncbi:cytoplasmic protein [Streptococcus sciuri]|uniref:Cytoplasmic protein n=1 Tax=Streptococcus sciuri TaxID=2973939 RepID=A0ABT2F7K4_9STRE|nr:cytoplasmic protein [Streptococcus sciuri]MCS4488447.1 cytoplasmic protein [Streptococcus sciuri]
MMKQYNFKNFNLTVFFSAEDSFSVTSTLVEKNGHAFLFNGKFIQSDGREIANYIKEQNLTLDAIFAMHGDPDFYFGIEAIKKEFPETVVYATQSTIEHIAATVVGKVTVFGDILGSEAPVNVVLPALYSKDSINFQGETFQIIGDSERINLYHAEEKILIGGIDVFNEMHLFLADTSKKEELKAWIDRLEDLKGWDYALVIPSHADYQGSFDKSVIDKSQAYLELAIAAQASSQNATEFEATILAKYETYINRNILDLSSKVLTGEMSWG